MKMNDLDRRLKRLEDQAPPSDPVQIEVFWANELDDPNGRIYEDEHGRIVRRATGEIIENMIHLDWPSAPDIDTDEEQAK